MRGPQPSSRSRHPSGRASSHAGSSRSTALRSLNSAANTTSRSAGARSRRPRGSTAGSGPAAPRARSTSRSRPGSSPRTPGGRRHDPYATAASRPGSGATAGGSTSIAYVTSRADGTAAARRSEAGHCGGPQRLGHLEDVRRVGPQVGLEHVEAPLDDGERGRREQRVVAVGVAAGRQQPEARHGGEPLEVGGAQDRGVEDVRGGRAHPSDPRAEPGTAERRRVASGSCLDIRARAPGPLPPPLSRRA